MLEMALAGFASVFTDWFALAMILFGVIVGFVMGTIPGLTGNMALALLIPMTYVMPTVGAVSLLMAITKAGTFGGSIPAILVNTPGTPAATATAMDGYPMALQGKGLKAMKMALHASAIGDFFSNIVLILVAQQLAVLALMMGAFERFALIVFALTIIGMVTGASLPKGLLSAALGLLLATVGMDPISGYPRFDFGSVDLSGGIGFVPMMIGLFAITEVMIQVGDRGKTVDGKSLSGRSVINISDRPENRRVSWSELRSVFKTIARSSVVGTFIGALPGLGASVAAWVGYGMAKNASKRAEEFGNGSIEGIAAAEAANNAVQGANYIPLLTLGIPGNMAAALVAGALMIKGLPVGPLIFEKAGPIIYAIFAAAIVAIFLYWILGMLFIRCGVVLTRLPKHYLFPVIAIVCVMGVYTINTNIFDVYVMLVSGALGYTMRRIGIPVAPLIIAFLLGPELELTLRHAMLMAQGDVGVFFEHPLALVLFLITAVTIVKMVMNRRKQRRAG